MSWLAIGNRQSAEGESSCIPNLLTNELATSGRCGWWVDVGVEPLAEALAEAMGLTDEERRAMGENGRRLVETKYQWSTIATEMNLVYEKVLKDGTTHASKLKTLM